MLERNSICLLASEVSFCLDKASSQGVLGGGNDKWLKHRVEKDLPF